MSSALNDRARAGSSAARAEVLALCLCQDIAGMSADRQGDLLGAVVAYGDGLVASLDRALGLDTGKAARARRARGARGPVIDWPPSLADRGAWHTREFMHSLLIADDLRACLAAPLAAVAADVRAHLLAGVEDYRRGRRLSLSEALSLDTSAAGRARRQVQALGPLAEWITAEGRAAGLDQGAADRTAAAELGLSVRQVQRYRAAHRKAQAAARAARSRADRAELLHTLAEALKPSR